MGGKSKKSGLVGLGPMVVERHGGSEREKFRSRAFDGPLGQVLRESMLADRLAKVPDEFLWQHVGQDGQMPLSHGHARRVASRLPMDVIREIIAAYETLGPAEQVALKNHPTRMPDENLHRETAHRTLVEVKALIDRHEVRKALDLLENYVEEYGEGEAPN